MTTPWATGDSFSSSEEQVATIRSSRHLFDETFRSRNSQHFVQGIRSTLSTMEEVTLLSGYWSPFSQRVHIALLEKGIPFENFVVNFANKPQILLDSNPIHKKVPVLLHKGKPVIESLVILQYLEDAWPEKPRLLPEDAYEKSRARFWTEYLYANFTTFLTTLKLPSGSPDHTAALETCVKVIKTVESSIASFSADGPYFTGEKFGYLDVIYAPLPGFLALFQFAGGLKLPSTEEIPRFSKWMKAVTSHPSVSAVMPADEALCEFFVWLSKKQSEAAAKAAQNAA